MIFEGVNFHNMTVSFPNGIARPMGYFILEGFHHEFAVCHTNNKSRFAHVPLDKREF